MAWRWSQTVRRLPAKQLQVGSTPTGASLKAMIRPGQRRTSPRPDGGWQCVFRSWVLTEWSCQLWLVASSPMIWDNTGSWRLRFHR